MISLPGAGGFVLAANVPVCLAPLSTANSWRISIP
jgi:hypothetical protein